MMSMIDAHAQECRAKIHAATLSLLRYVFTVELANPTSFFLSCLTQLSHFYLCQFLVEVWLKVGLLYYYREI